MSMSLKPMFSSNKKRRPNRRGRRYETAWPTKYLETLVTQCIVCAILLSVALIVRLIEVPQTLALRSLFLETVSANIDVAYEARNFGALIMTVLGGDDESEAIPAGPAGRDPEVMLENTTQGGTGTVDFRIDEDILATIDGQSGETDDKERGVVLIE